MYKWHSQLARSSRPVSRDLQVVTDGIAASLRAFSISASQAAEEVAEKPRFTISRVAQDVKPSTRSARTQTATDAISSLRPSQPRPTGIDARAFAARPIGEGEQRPRFAFANRGRGGGRGGARGRGGMRGRGGARGGARGVGQKRGPKQKRRQIIMEEEPEEEDVIAYMNMREMGVWEPAKTGLDTAELERFVPDMGAMAYAPSQEEAIRGHFRSITGQVANEKTEGTWHSQRYLQGEGTLFVDSAERKSVTKDRHYDWTPSRYAHLPKAVQELMIKQLVGGEYTKLEEVKKGDTVKTVQVNTLRNETYLSTDTIKITEKVQKMVPIPKPAAKKPVGKPAKK